MSTDNIFGSIVTGKQVRVAIREHIRAWFPTYIAEIARVDGRAPENMPLFRSFPSALDMPDGRFIEDQMPSCVIVAPGLIQEPVRHRGRVTARWAVSIGAVVAGQDRENTFDLSEMYAAAVRSLVVQNPSLGNFATATDWLGERYDDIPNDMSRTLAAGTVQFAVEVEQSIDPSAGPDAPLTDPIPDPGARATFTEVTLTTEGA